MGSKPARGPAPEPDQPYSLRELRRFAEAPLRHPWVVLVPLVLLPLAAVGASFLFPPRYSSSTLILVAPDQVPSNFIPQMTTERVARRLQTLRQEVQSRTRLEMVARELDPYGTLGKEPLINTIERMRSATTVSVKGNDAFGIEFEHRDPKMAMLVADRLTTLFMEEVAGARERQVSEAYQFIDSQMDEARRRLEEKEKALAEFKQRYMGELPEQTQANLATLQRLQLEQQTIADNLRRAMDTQLLLEGGGTVAGGAPAAAPDSLTALRAQLAQLRTRYTDKHPDVKALLSRIAALESAASSTAPSSAPIDPAAAAAQRRLEESRREVQDLKVRLAEVDKRISAFQARVEAAPERQQEILGITRDYQKLSDSYTQLLSKKLEAEMASRLEQRYRGQQFRVIDPAYLPVQPSFPNRRLFALAGALAGLLLGVGLAVVIDHLDPTFKEADEASTALNLPVLASIPHVRPKEQRRLAALPIEGPSGPRRDDTDDTLPRSRAVPFKRPAGRSGGRS
jgi:polysaccharide chain length determinant protein (PEP-CTERM system associated)